MGGVSAAPARTIANGPAAARDELAAAFAAVRQHLWVVVVLFGLAAIAWWSTIDRMAGMDAGPGTDLGALGWFVGVWVVMMAAMMFPSLAPDGGVVRANDAPPRSGSRAAVQRRLPTRLGRSRASRAYGLFELGKTLFGGALAWSSGGRWVAAGVLSLAAVYELTPLKGACLAKCRSPLGFLLGTWRDGSLGAVEMGCRHAAWCLGCCWALMAALFALGVMSLTWMVLIAALIALEKTVPWRRAVTWGTAALLLTLAVAVIAAPGSVPGLVVPGGSQGAMHAMGAMR